MYGLDSAVPRWTVLRSCAHAQMPDLMDRVLERVRAPGGDSHLTDWGPPLCSRRVVPNELLSVYCRLPIDLSYIASFDDIYDFC